MYYLEDNSIKIRDDGRQEQSDVPDIKCPICLDDVKVDQEIVYKLEACAHSHHKECLKTCIMKLASTRFFPMQCPILDCKKEIDNEEIKNLLEGSTEDQKLYEKYYKRYIIETNPKNYIYCPGAGCEHVWYIASKLEGKKLDCPECKKSYCVKCKAEWHEQKNCRKARRYRDKQTDEFFDKYASKMKYKKCPQCGQTIERTRGCNAMSCIRCKTPFCYKCGKRGDGHKCIHKKNE